VEEEEGVVAQHVEGTTFPTIPKKQMEEVISRQQHIASFAILQKMDQGNLLGKRWSTNKM